MRRCLSLVLGAAVLLAAAACGDDEPAHDDAVRLNEIQVLGTHNSYKERLPGELFELLEQFDPDLAASLDYGHRPIPEQLAQLGARQLELDVFADPEGGRFAERAANALVGLPVEAEDPAMQEPGFKVFHVQEVDYASTCPTFVACLTEVRDWSSDNPDHLPILILVEAKDSAIPDPVELGFVQPLPIGPEELDELDAEIRSVFDDDHVLTPDDVRGDAATLRDAVTGEAGWPTLADARGKVLFALDNTGDILDHYLAGHDGLEGRVMFASVDPDDPGAAFVKLNDPLADGDRITELVRAGFIVRTRADAETEQARTGGTEMRDAALASGAQFVSTDYLEPDPQFTDYSVGLPGGGVARCNPVLDLDRCDSEALAGAA